MKLAAGVGIVQRRQRPRQREAAELVEAQRDRVRAGGMRTWARPSAGSIASSTPFISRPFMPSIWQGSGSASGTGAG